MSKTAILDNDAREARSHLRLFMTCSWATEADRLDAAIKLADLENERLNRRARLFTVIGSWLVLIALAMFCTCCGASSSPVYPDQHASKPRTAAEQTESAVKIELACVAGDAFSGSRALSINMGAGSGVIIATGSVLTVAHVVECDGASLIHVVTASGSKYEATVLVLDKSRDYARLSVPGIHAVNSAVIGAVKPGDDVCVVPAHPYRSTSCGKLVKRQWQHVENGIVDLWSTARTVPGNSGSAMYNAAGELVGLATNKLPCITDPWADDCGGLATSLAGRVR